jgi:RHS repeat-associated protein
MGSLVAITDESGILLESRNYDPWGKPRNPQTLAYTLSNPFGGSNSSYTLRGYTFHEHYEMFDLINMNGRLYDNQIGQFINADPILADNENLQNYNRYSYVMNNPLKYTDPSGYVYVGGGGAGTYGSGTSMEEISQTSRETERFEKGIQEAHTSFIDDIKNFFISAKAYILGDENYQIYKEIKLDEVIISSSKRIYSSAPQSKDFSGFLGKIHFFWTGGNIDGYRYSIDGNAIGYSPIIGEPPGFIGGPLRKGQSAIKLGKYLFNPTAFHIIKQEVLIIAKPQNFTKIVGSNPDFMFKGGTIWLTGTKNGGYFGKSYDTGMKILDFIELF